MNKEQYYLRQDFIKKNIVELCRDIDSISGLPNSTASDLLQECVKMGDSNLPLTKMTIHMTAGRMVALGELVLSPVANNQIKGN